jgi:hypothetical protein
MLRLVSQKIEKVVTSLRARAVDPLKLVGVRLVDRQDVVLEVACHHHHVCGFNQGGEKVSLRSALSHALFESCIQIADGLLGLDLFRDVDLQAFPQQRAVGLLTTGRQDTAPAFSAISPVEPNLDVEGLAVADCFDLRLYEAGLIIRVDQPVRYEGSWRTASAGTPVSRS